MRSRYTFIESEGIYFLTPTIIEWLPFFTDADAFTIITDSLTFCRHNKGLRPYAYVVLENHLHLVAEAPDLARTIQSFKRHTSRKLLQWAETKNKTWLINQFAYFRKKYKYTSVHQVWQEGVHPEFIQGDNMLQQKIEYIHANPVRRGYVDAPEHWRYSSARNYTLDDHAVLEIDLIPW